MNVYFNSAESDEKWYNTLVTTEFQPPFYIFGPGKSTVVLECALFFAYALSVAHLISKIGLKLKYVCVPKCTRCISVQVQLLKL